MGRSPCCEKVGLKKGPWTPEEDEKLLAYIEEHGHGGWRSLPHKAGLQRCGKSCRLRWVNYLRPDIKRGKFTVPEEQTIIQLHSLLGNRWSAIATHLPKRTDNEIKNYWNTHLKKRLTKMGIDPVTHKPNNDTILSGRSKISANLTHMAQWESARLEAEARLVKLRSRPFQIQHLTNKPASSSSGTHSLDILKPWSGSLTNNKPIYGQDHESPTSTLTGPAATFEFVGSSGSPDELKDSMEISRCFASSFHDMTSLSMEADTLTAESLRTSTVHDHHDHRSLSDSGSGDSDNGSGGSEYEDNKNYWNSILNLVNSSPSESSMF